MNSPLRQFALTSRRVITLQGERRAAILIVNGAIVDVVSADRIPPQYPVEDVGDLVVMPGLVDTHVHINEPGRTDWEGFDTATQAAAAGGITTLVDMPLNSLPVTTTVDALAKKMKAAEGKLHVDCGFYAGMIPGNTDAIEPLMNAGILGVKAFLIHSGIDDFPNVSEKDLRAAMPIIAKHGVPLLVHCELSTYDANLTSHIANHRAYSSFLASRPREWEHDAIALMIRLCREYTCKVHIVHVSSSDAILAIHGARAAGLPLTTEACPHYLCFTAEEIRDGDTRFKCAPPIREHENRERLWDALKKGDLDFIVSDHSPSLPELKCLDSGDFQKAWGGISSLQFGLPAVWTEARKRGFGLSNIAEWMSRRPAQFVGLDKKGAIAPSHDADLVVWNPDEEFIVERSMIFHRHKLTPYEGKHLSGKVVTTYLRGRKIFDHGVIISEPQGTMLLRTQTQQSLWKQ